MREDLPVFGCYLHGLFDDPLVRRGFLGALGGVGRAVDDSSPAWNRLREERLKRLAEAVRSSLDVESVYNLLGLEGSHG
jgi:adenosylcobyric acid synthase